MGYLGTPIDTNNTFQSLQGKRFSGNGSTTAFTLDIAPASTLDIEVFVENVRQDPNSAYTVSGTTLAFSAAPDAGTNNIYVVHQAKAVATISAGAGTVNAASMDNTVISGQTALAAEPADTDEFLVSDAGTIKRIDYSLIKASNTPAFEAHLSSDASFNTNTSTKITFDTEIYDTDSTYNVSNGRFTPGVAGKYFVYTTITATAGATNNVVNKAQIYINGAVGPGIISSFNFTGNYLNVHVAIAQGVFNLDTDDYIEIFGRCLTSNGAAGTFTAGNRSTMFGAYKIIGA